jgi:hypothetical protein
MKKCSYVQPDAQLRRLVAVETVSTSGDGMVGDDNEFDAGNAWP